MEFEERGPEALQGKDSNYFKVGNTAYKFIFDFGWFHSSSGKFQIHTRIITSPAKAKALLRTLQESIEKHERNHGAISGEESGE